ncbi:MAG: EndoU domain-containing protein [Blautia sp.]|nr:EndoU domain-containing protein [Blautia sp.]
MGSGSKGLYSGAYTGETGKKPDYKPEPTTYRATQALKDHIENPQPTSSNSEGIKGAHNKDNFTAEAKRVGAKTISSQSNSQLDGVEKIEYQMPKKDRFGKPTGEYKAKKFSKTVYDPSKISTDTYVKWGIQAANNAAKNSSTGKLGREWTGTDNQGVKWHGYCDANGKITSFYPED